MENTSRQALIPFEQDIMQFHGHEILAARLPDDRIAAILNSLCAMLGVRTQMQVRRIRRDENLAQHLLLALVETSGGLQRMDVLIAEAIPDWVMGLQLKRVAPEKRPLILALKVEIVEALHRHFFPAQPTQPMPEPQAEPLPSPSRSRSSAASGSPWDQLFEGLVDVQGGLDDIREALSAIRQEEQVKAGRLAVVEEWLTSLDRRVAASGQGSAAAMGWTPTLSAAHLTDLQMLFRSFEQATGRTQAQLEQELLEPFRVPAINAILDELWQDVLDWWTWRAQQPR